MSEKKCMTCSKACSVLEKKLLKSCLSDLGGTVFSSVNPRPNSKYHTVIMTKQHTEDLRTLTDQEWNDILPVLKDSITKIENYYKCVNKSGPLGYRISIPIGELAAQNIPQHFYCHVVPKYKENYGSTMVPYNYKYEAGQNFAENKEKIRASLQPNQDTEE